jgi:N4-(beta-N-acetylglucosaminyl)-L-asparaginase
MRQGMAPQAACLKALERVVAMTETRLMGPGGRPRFDLEFYALTKNGDFGGATLYSGGKFAVCDERGPRLETAAYLYQR